MISGELWAIDRVDGGLAADTIANVWTAVTGWFDPYMWAATVALLLLLVGVTYLILVRRRTRS